MDFSSQQVIDETRRFFTKVYAWMFLGLLVSGVTAYYVAFTPELTEIILGSKTTFIGLLIFEFVLVFSLAFFINKIHSSMGFFLFFLYCFTTGLTLSVIFIIYTIDSIGMTFFICASMFGFMSVYGFFTKKDLTGLGKVLIMGLFGLIIASIINLFLKNSLFDYILSFIGVIIFTGLTAYDTQKIKNKNIIGNEGTDEDLKESIIGALTLYLDFINLFLNLLKLFGKRK